MDGEQSGVVDESARAAFRELEQSEDMYRLLVENSLGLVCAHDLEGRLLMVNRAAAHLLACTPEDLIGRSIADLMDPKVRPLFARYLRIVKKNQEARGQLRLVKPDGQLVTWSYHNSLHRGSNSSIVIGHAIDITAHLALEHDLGESREQYRRLFEDAPIAYHEIDREGVIVRVNKAECHLLGWSKEEMLGRPVWDFISAGQQETSKNQVKRKLSGHQLLVPFYREYVRKDGERLTLLIHENLISANKVIVGIRSALLDATEQHRAQLELRRVNEELDERIAQRTAELEASNQRLNQFVHMASHDLQEPLRSTSAFSALLKQRYASHLDEEGLGFLDHVVSSARRMSILVQDLLTYSRSTGDDTQLALVDLNAALDAALANLRNSLDEAGARVERAGLPTLHAQFTAMMQLFQNLIDNALKYRSRVPPVIDITGIKEKNFWIISVADNGVGIPPSERQRVFGLFNRSTTAGAGGSGIGLAICKAIVERHKGRIWIEEGNEEGGCTFRFTLAES